jgi:hypothetical protein
MRLPLVEPAKDGAKVRGEALNCENCVSCPLDVGMLKTEINRMEMKKREKTGAVLKGQDVSIPEKPKAGLPFSDSVLSHKKLLYA